MLQIIKLLRIRADGVPKLTITNTFKTIVEILTCH